MRAAVLRAIAARPVLDRAEPAVWAWSALTLTLCAITVDVTASGAGTQPELVAVARALTVGVPMAVGIYAWRRRPDERFGPLLLATGGLWFVTTLAESHDEVLYSVGRAAGWLAELALVYLVLTFPDGRLRERVDRRLVWLGAALVGTLYLPTLLLSDAFGLPSVVTGCGADCPPNAFMALDAEPGVVEAVLLPLRELLTIALLAAATVRLTQRLGSSTRLMHQAAGPVLGVAIACLTLAALLLAARRVAPDEPLALAGGWLVAFAVPALAIAFLAGLLRQRLYVADCIQRLAVRLGGRLDAVQLRDAFAEAFDDPDVELAFPVDDVQRGWAGADGAPTTLPRPGGRRCVTAVHGADGPVAAIIHDETLRDQRDLVVAAGAYVATALENARLSAQVEVSRRELQASRARILDAADHERRRIERDLHDGAQQRLVALRIELELAEELVDRDPARGRERLHALGEEVERTLDEIRSLARGVYPPLLADRGLVEALRVAASHAALPTSIVPYGVGRHGPQVESAVYFSVLEALQNAAKHADGARRVSVRLEEDRELRFVVRDDGAGFDPAEIDPGAGLTNIRDRLGAVGGEVLIESAPGAGTAVSGRVPLVR